MRFATLILGLASTTSVLAQDLTPHSIFQSIQPYCDSPEYAGCHAMAVKHFNNCDPSNLMCQCNQLYALKDFCAQSCDDKPAFNKPLETDIEKVCGTSSEIHSTIFGLRQLFPFFENEFYAKSDDNYDDDEDDEDDDYDDCDNGDDSDDGAQWHQNDPEYLKRIAAMQKSEAQYEPAIVSEPQAAELLEASPSVPIAGASIYKRADVETQSDVSEALQHVEDCDCGPNAVYSRPYPPSYNYLPSGPAPPSYPVRPPLRAPSDYNYRDTENESSDGDDVNDDDCDDSEENSTGSVPFRSRLPPGLRRITGGGDVATAAASNDIVQINAMPKLKLPWFNNADDTTEPAEPTETEAPTVEDPELESNSDEVKQSGFLRDHLPSRERLHLPDFGRKGTSDQEAPVVEEPITDSPELPSAPYASSAPEAPILPEVPQPDDAPVVPSPIYETPEAAPISPPVAPPVAPILVPDYNSSFEYSGYTVNASSAQKNQLRINALGDLNSTTRLNSTTNMTRSDSSGSMSKNSSAGLLVAPVAVSVIAALISYLITEV